MAGDEIRVVLVKPGDVLLIGNIDPSRVTGPETEQAIAHAFETLRRTLGLEVVAFAGDIDIALWERRPAESVATS